MSANTYGGVANRNKHSAIRLNDLLPTTLADTLLPSRVSMSECAVAFHLSSPVTEWSFDARGAMLRDWLWYRKSYNSLPVATVYVLNSSPISSAPSIW